MELGHLLLNRADPDNLYKCTQMVWHQAKREYQAFAFLDVAMNRSQEAQRQKVVTEDRFVS